MSCELNEMVKCFMLFCLIAVILDFVKCQGDKMIGPGVWNVLQASKCENSEDYPIQVDISRRKMNRLQDGFTVLLKTESDIDDTAAIMIDVYKKTDGNQYKQYQVLSDDSLPRFANKYAEANVAVALTMAKMDPPEFPIRAGEYEIVDYIFDYSELPDEAVYGEFEAYAYMMVGGEKAGCLMLRLEFTEVEDK